MDVKTVVRELYGTSKDLPSKSIFAQTWRDWYRGKVTSFHNYRIYNGENPIMLEMKSLQMAKHVCETWASLILNEKCDIVLGEEDKPKLDDIFKQNNFWVKANGGVEKTFAFGLGAFVVNVKGLGVGERTGNVTKDKAYLSVDFVDERKIEPITIENKRIVECAFVSEGSHERNIVVHKRDKNGYYTIYNYVIEKKTGKIVDSYNFETKSQDKWFFVIRPNIESNIVSDLMDEEIGISVFANRIDTLKAIDTKYDAFDMEYLLGRKRLFVSGEDFTVNMDGEQKKVFDPSDILFYKVGDNDKGQPLIEDKTSELRYEAYIRGINAEMNYLSSGCGLGENFYKYDGSMISTATQVISENSTLYRNLKKHEIVIEDALYELTKAIIYASNKFTNIQFSPTALDDIRIVFDDSIIEDKDSEMKRDREDVQAGILSPAEYRSKWYGEQLDVAEENMRKYFLADQLAKYIAPLEIGAITPEQFVETVYPNAKNKETIVSYISSFMQQGSNDVPHGLYDGDESGIQEEETAEEIEE